MLGHGWLMVGSLGRIISTRALAGMGVCVGHECIQASGYGYAGKTNVWDWLLLCR
jgi:hypothetical protein